MEVPEHVELFVARMRPAGPMPGPRTLALVLRLAYAFGLTPPPATDQEHVEQFRAFLTGQGPPRRVMTDYRS